jgi:ABC-type amino acid transport system permease subunit
VNKTSVYLTDEDLAALRAASSRTGKSIAELIRDGVRQVTNGSRPAFASRGAASGTGESRGRTVDERLRQSLQPRP